jgi:protein-disulfide isomerase
MRLHPIAVAAVLAVVAACAKSAQPAAFAVPLGDAPTRGPADAWVTIVEFSDFECPYCKQAAATLVQLLAEYPDDVRLAFRHFPLSSLHPSARPASIAAECARAQGHFWEMHDRIFAGQPALSSDDLVAYATGADVDVGAWKECLSAPEPAARVDADFALGRQLEVTATPTFAINGERLVGTLPLAQFERLVESARATAQASGIPRAEYYDRAVLGK